jgi:hypothetical protein
VTQERPVDAMTTDYRALPSGYIDPEHKGEDLALLETFYRACLAEGGTVNEIELRGIRAVLATHSTPQPPADGEVGYALLELRSLVMGLGYAGMHVDAQRLERAADLLERQHLQPVAVSERPWERDGWGEVPMPMWDYGRDLAAALRSAAEQLSYKNELGLTHFGGHCQARDQLLAIASELEGNAQ